MTLNLEWPWDFFKVNVVFFRMTLIYVPCDYCELILSGGWMVTIFPKKSVILGWILAQNSKFKMAAMRPPKGLEGQGSGDKVFSKGQIDTQVLNKIHGIDYDNQV